MAMMLAMPVAATADGGPMQPWEQAQFWKLGLKEGLSNSQVNCMLKDSRGFVWFGTGCGLNRYDGVRFKKFFSSADNELTLPNDVINELYEDSEGRLWVRTMTGYCLYDPLTESFDRHPETWLQSMGVEGSPSLVFIDSARNIYVVVNGRGIYCLQSGLWQPGASSGARCKFFPFGSGRGRIPAGEVTRMVETKGTAVLIMNDGTMARIDGVRGRLLWVNRHIPQQLHLGSKGFSLLVDSENNYWMGTDGASLVYSARRNQWFPTVAAWLQAEGYAFSDSNVLVRDIAEDRQGRMWIATDHSGLLLIDRPNHRLTAYTADKNAPQSIPDNTLQSLMLDGGALWVGTYKNGVACLNEQAARFGLLDVGDVCTICEDKQGNLWCGTNDKGIVCYHPLTGNRRAYHRADTGLGTDVVVSSLCASDGSLWFGTYNGGLAHYANGRWTVFNTRNGLANDNVWSLAEDKHGRVLIGTLGGGLQVYDPAKEEFIVCYQVSNADLQSNYISSIFVNAEGDVLLGHSQHFTILHGGVPTDMKHSVPLVENYNSTRSGRQFSSPAINQIYQDSRGLVWMATSSGVNVYDMRSDELTILNFDSGLSGSVACSVAETADHEMWVAADNGLSLITVGQDKRGHTFSIATFGAADGLQERQFNFRSMLVAASGDVLIGGQDGVNVIPHQHVGGRQAVLQAVFSGLVLFDHPLSVGEAYNGRVVLKRALNESRRLDLTDAENAFTIQLATDHPGPQQHNQMQYRLLGLNEQWMRTSTGRSEATFTSLSPGKYRLQVQVLDRYGRPFDKVSELTIVVHPPFYRSPWAVLLYVLLLAALVYAGHRRAVRRQQARFRIEQERRETEKERELDELKMQFFTNASHELRTPLTLIISPLARMAQQEDNPEKRTKLEMIQRNATKLLNLVNQLLDFRKLDVNMETLNPVTGDIIAYIKDVCNSFKLLQDKQINLSVESDTEHLVMAFDDDKMGKVMNNLLSNAYKFTPSGGNVAVKMHADDEAQRLQISVADTGIGIADADKQHVFDRFYQARRMASATKDATMNAYGGSGVGLHLVKNFVELHGGTVSIADNAGGGTVFTVQLPIRHDDTLRRLVTAPVAESEQKAEGRGEYEVLIVDDSDDFLEFMTDVLRDTYRIRTAHDGKEAILKITEKQPDVILSDVMMPVMDGNELCRTLKRNPETQKIPFIMLTARLAQAHRIEGLESGADDYITKPFNLDLLHLRIANLIKWRNGGAAAKYQPELAEIEITSLDEKLVKKATAYVEKELGNPDLSVELMSRELGMSRVHLYKKLLSLTGTTPSEFIRQIRLRRAEQLLRQSQKSVSEIAYEVGFNNPRYFSKYFKDMYGMMPSQYKEVKSSSS